MAFKNRLVFEFYDEKKPGQKNQLSSFAKSAEKAFCVPFSVGVESPFSFAVADCLTASQFMDSGVGLHPKRAVVTAGSYYMGTFESAHLATFCSPFCDEGGYGNGLAGGLCAGAIFIGVMELIELIFRWSSVICDWQ